MWLFLLLTACPGPKQRDCDLMAVASVNVELLTEDGGEPEEVELTWSVDGGDAQPCESFSPGEWVCAWEVAGELTIHADAWGYGEVTERVTVEEDVCHVIPEQLTLTLPELDCAAQPMPSVIVTVEDDSGARVPEAEVAYAPHDEDWMQPEPCDAYGEAQFACGEERAGVLDIWIDAEGLQSDYIEVDVPAGECHVDTQEVTVTLQP